MKFKMRIANKKRIVKHKYFNSKSMTMQSAVK